VNASGQVVGYSTIASGEYHAFSWTREGGMIDLGTIGGRNYFTTAVNDIGQVVGWSNFADGKSRPFSWTLGGGMIDLGTLGARYLRPHALVRLDPLRNRGSADDPVGTRLSHQGDRAK
jgi:probable HAF family extracellular repeat protein